MNLPCYLVHTVARELTKTLKLLEGTKLESPRNWNAWKEPVARDHILIVARVLYNLQVKYTRPIIDDLIERRAQAQDCIIQAM